MREIDELQAFSVEPCIMFENVDEQHSPEGSSKLELVEEQDSAPDGRAPRALTQRQIDWVDEYVLNGRNGYRASLAVGYSPASAINIGSRNLKNPLILERIQIAAGETIKAKLPEIIEALLQLIEDPKTSPMARVQAAFGLMDRAGMAKPSGPGVTVNVNQPQDSKSVAQELIAQIWQEKEKRMTTSARLSAMGSGRKLSAIDDTMSDTSDHATVTIEQTVPAVQDGGRGGMIFQGPATGSRPIPPPTTEHGGASLKEQSDEEADRTGGRFEWARVIAAGADGEGVEFADARPGEFAAGSDMGGVGSRGGGSHADLSGGRLGGIFDGSPGDPGGVDDIARRGVRAGDEEGSGSAGLGGGAGAGVRGPDVGRSEWLAACRRRSTGGVGSDA